MKTLNVGLEGAACPTEVRRFKSRAAAFSDLPIQLSAQGIGIVRAVTGVLTIKRTNRSHRDRRWRVALASSATAYLTVVGACLPGPSQASDRCYKAESLKGPNGERTSRPIQPVCLALEKNLNEFCDQPPMVCDLKIHPKHARDLALPKWEPVDLDGSLGLLEDLIRAPYLSARDARAASQVWESARPDIEAAFNERRLKVSTAQLDLYQTGFTAKTYRYDLGDCAQKNPRLEPSNDGGAWRTELAAPEVRVSLAPEEYRAIETRYYMLAHGTIDGQVFFYRGRTFTYYMLGYHRKGVDPSLPPTNEVRVNQGAHFLLNGKPTIDYRQVCELNYEPARNAK